MRMAMMSRSSSSVEKPASLRRGLRPAACRTPHAAAAQVEKPASLRRGLRRAGWRARRSGRVVEKPASLRRGLRRQSEHLRVEAWITLKNPPRSEED
mgnify:CR=1 FL=1